MPTSTPRDEERENRIEMEIIVDAYDEIEQRIGWYCHLENELKFPFHAICIRKITGSPLKFNQQVEVIGMLDAEECEDDMEVLIKYDGDELPVPLAQLQPVGAPPETEQAAADWRYWVDRGYTL